jgi:CBS domain-containing protein
MNVKDLMTTDVVSVRPDTSVKNVAQLMLRHRISAIPVVDDQGGIVGIVSEGDLMCRPELGGPQHRPWWLAAFARPQDVASEYVRSHGRCAKDVMTTDVVTTDETKTARDVAALLEKKGIKRLPVVRDARLVGIISRADLLHGIVAAGFDQTAPGDEAVRLAVATRIRREAGVRDAFLSVVVANGVVHLWGALRSDAERAAARVAAETVRGVQGVVDHTSVLPDALLLRAE